MYKFMLTTMVLAMFDEDDRYKDMLAECEENSQEYLFATEAFPWYATADVEYENSLRRGAGIPSIFA